MEKSLVFVVSANDAVRDSTRQLIEAAGLHAQTFATIQAFLDAVVSGRRACLVLDVNKGDLSDPQGQTLLARACARVPGLLIVDRGDVPMAVKAVKAGAREIVQKPYADENLLRSIKQALQAVPLFVPLSGKM